jgi:hypothetical protein
MPADEALAAHAAGGPVAKRKKAKHNTAKRSKATRERASKANKKKNEPKPALCAVTIFTNERRPAIMEALRAKGDQVDPADIDRQIAALWRAEPNWTEYYARAVKDSERYADEKATFDWEGGAADQAVKKRTAAPKKRAPSFEDAAQTPPAHDVTQPRWASVFIAAASIYSYAVGYLQPFLVPVNGNWVDSKMARHQRTRWAALQLVAAGRGLLRAPTCNHTLRVASGVTSAGQASLRRALLLLGPGELQELRELRSREDIIKKGSCDFIVSMLEQEAGVSRLSSDGGTPQDTPVARAVASLRVVKADVTLYPALIQQCAATLTELECNRLSDAATRVLPRCTRLESFTLNEWYGCPPAAWLGLSQLHTLRGVSLCEVPAAAIAAALPRLHTLHLNNRHGEFPVAGFYDELLPRLRSFHLEGTWPQTDDEPEMADVVRLPLLEDLKWRSNWDINLPRRLMGARPSTLDSSLANLVAWLQAADRARSPDSPNVTSPLAHVRALTVGLGRTLPDAALLARLLRAAPHLQQLAFCVYVWEHALWVLSDEFTPELVHPRLQRVAVFGKNSSPTGPVPSGCGVRLRQRHFPRLRRLTVYDEAYPVWVPRPAKRCKTF